MEASMRDLEVVHALQISPRVSWTKLAEILDRHPSTLSNQWARLRGDGVAWVTGHLGTEARQTVASFIQVETRPGERGGLIERLSAVPAIATIEEFAREWDLRLTVLTRSWETTTRDVLPLVRADPSVVRCRSSLGTRLYAIGNVWRLDVLSPQQQRRIAETNAVADGQVLPPQDVDRLLTVLGPDGRISAVDAAAALGVHPSTVTRHVRQAIGSGTVALRCELAQAYTGFPMVCHWHVRVPSTQLEAAVAHLRTYRTLRLCASTTGDTNLSFVLWLRRPSDIADVEAGLHRAAPALQVIDADVGVRTHKRMGWILRDDTTATGEVVV